MEDTGTVIVIVTVSVPVDPLDPELIEQGVWMWTGTRERYWRSVSGGSRTPGPELYTTTDNYSGQREGQDLRSRGREMVSGSDTRSGYRKESTGPRPDSWGSESGE